jgi:DNA-binding PadR family transcriptional regulator
MRGTLLGLLLERPGHGGDLANRLAARLGETWRIDTNDVYRLLEQLEQAGLAVSREEPKRGGGGTHLVYHPTEATSDALSQWIGTVAPREPFRLGLQAKLAVARPDDAPQLLSALRAYERECLVLTHMVLPGDGEARSWAALCLDCSSDVVQAQLRTEMDWAARTQKRISEFLDAGYE